MKPIRWFIAKGLLMKDWTAPKLSSAYMKKARSNIITMELLSKTNKYSEVLALPLDYDSSEWVVVSAYYAMYMAALSALAKLGYRSKNHSATVVALEELLVKKHLLEKQYLASLEKIKLKKEELEELERARDRREIAQYSVTRQMTKQIAEEIEKRGSSLCRQNGKAA